MNLAKNKKNYEELVKEYDAIPKDVEESTMMDTGEYEKLNNLYQAESNMSTGITQIFVDLKSGIDNLFGEGIFDLFTQGYQDEVMLDPLFEAVKPFFEEAGKDRQSKVDSVKLNRAERRSIKK